MEEVCHRVDLLQPSHRKHAKPRVEALKPLRGDPAKVAVPLSITSTGNPPGVSQAEVLFFVHGWPDDATVWQKQVEYFKHKYNCCRVTMPFYGGRDSSSSLGHRVEGYDFYELADILAENIRSKYSEPVLLVAHDWGCIWGFLLQARHPGLVKKIIALDVGQPSCVTSRVKVLLALFTYQFWPLAALFLLRMTARVPFLRSVGQTMADAMMRLVVRFFGQGSQTITAEACFPYFHYVKNLGFPDAPKVGSGRLLPSCPCLFMYGRRKPYMQIIALMSMSFHVWKAEALHVPQQSLGNSFAESGGLRGHQDECRTLATDGPLCVLSFLKWRKLRK